MRIRVICLTLALSILPPSIPRTSIASPAPYKQIPTVCLETSTTIAASPSRVWAFVTKGKDLVTWCPMWKSQANAKVSIVKVGDVLDYTDAWGNGGVSVVTYLAPDKEIRVSHEPNDGSYMCQAKLVLTAKGAATEVRYWEQYTDASSEKELAVTAGKTSDEMSRTLEALKKAVEKK